MKMQRTMEMTRTPMTKDKALREMVNKLYRIGTLMRYLNVSYATRKRHAEYTYSFIISTLGLTDKEAAFVYQSYFNDNELKAKEDA